MLDNQSLKSLLDHERLDERLVIAPLLDPTQIGPASIDLRLGTEFLETPRTERGVTDPFEPVNDRRFVVPFGHTFVIHPGQFLLGSTFEYIRMPYSHAGQVLNRSSWARNGLIVATAVTVQPGFGGTLTLELVNMGAVPLQLHTGSRIAQLVVWGLQATTQQPYDVSPKYDAPLGPQSSRLDREAEEVQRLTAIYNRLHLIEPDNSQPSDND